MSPLEFGLWHYLSALAVKFPRTGTRAHVMMIDFHDNPIILPPGSHGSDPTEMIDRILFTNDILFVILFLRWEDKDKNTDSTEIWKKNQKQLLLYGNGAMLITRVKGEKEGDRWSVHPLLCPESYRRPGFRPPGLRISCPRLSLPRNEFSQSPPGKPERHSIRFTGLPEAAAALFPVI